MSYHDYEYERTGLYRSNRGVIAGVCRGVAEYFDVSVFWTRVLMFAFFLSTGFFPAVVVYILAALLMKKEPCVRWEA